MKISITEKPFGSFESQNVMEYTLSNANGMQVAVLNYGGTVNKIIAPDKNGVMGNVILGFDDLDSYLKSGNQYAGSIVGRYCNRIANAKFLLDGLEYRLSNNEKKNTLHGGIKGFDKVIWNIEKREDECSLKLTYFSKDGEEGFPGNLNIEVIYSLTPDNALIIDYKATSDKSTPVNFTSHCYFNLSAGKVSSVLDHELTLYADKYTPVDDNMIPTGDLATVENTPLDFRKGKKVGSDLEKLSNGYDNNFVLNKNSKIAASLFDPESRRNMDVSTTEPALQFYLGDFQYTSAPESDNALKRIRHAAVCLEAQHYPNSPNEPTFPDTILNPGDVYRQTTIYKFSVK